MTHRVITLLMLAGCGHVRVAQVDYESGRFALCRNRHADDEDMSAEAWKHCKHGEPVKMKCDSVATGSYTTPIQNFSTGQVYGYATNQVSEWCCGYRCE